MRPFTKEEIKDYIDDLYANYLKLNDMRDLLNNGLIRARVIDKSLPDLCNILDEISDVQIKSESNEDQLLRLKNLRLSIDYSLGKMLDSYESNCHESIDLLNEIHERNLRVFSELVKVLDPDSRVST